jgi:hypothetical protein
MMLRILKLVYICRVEKRGGADTRLDKKKESNCLIIN